MVRFIIFFCMICQVSWAQNRERKKYLVILGLPSVVQDSADLLAQKQMSRLSFQTLSRDYQWLLSRETEDFFLLNGFSVELNSREYEQLKREPRVRSLTDLSRKITLKRGETSQFGLESQKPTTYGIEKIKVKALQTQHPQLLGTGVRVSTPRDRGFCPSQASVSGEAL